MLRLVEVSIVVDVSAGVVVIVDVSVVDVSGAVVVIVDVPVVDDIHEQLL